MKLWHPLLGEKSFEKKHAERILKIKTREPWRPLAEKPKDGSKSSSGSIEKPDK